MFVARHPEGHLVALPGAPEADRKLARVVAGQEAVDLTQALRCADIHCDAVLIQKSGEQKRPHWAHKAGAVEHCAEDRAGGEGEWHRWMCRDVLGRAHAHEYSVGAARADAVVQRCNKLDKLAAIEVQHSAIKKEVVRRRHDEHAAGGLIGTIWLVDGEVAGIRHDDAWATGADGGIRQIRTTWVIDLLRACVDTPMPYGCVVGFVVRDPSRGTVGVRFVDTVDFGEASDGARLATVRSWTNRVGEATLREWAAGPERVIQPAMEASRRILDAAATRRVKVFKHNPWKRR